MKSYLWLGVALAWLTGCSGGGPDSDSPDPSEQISENGSNDAGANEVSTESDTVNGINQALKIVASNIVVNAHAATAKSATDVDTNTKVLADNVVVDNDENALDSENLQDALDKEIAPVAAKTLVGTWVCKNSAGTETGKVTLNGTNYAVDSGHCMHLGNDVPGVGCVTPLTYKVVENSFLLVDKNSNADDCGNKNASVTGTTTYFMTELTNDKIVVWASGSLIFTLTK